MSKHLKFQQDWEDGRPKITEGQVLGVLEELSNSVRYSYINNYDSIFRLLDAVYRNIDCGSPKILVKGDEEF